MGMRKIIRAGSPKGVGMERICPCPPLQPIDAPALPQRVERIDAHGQKSPARAWEDAARRMIPANGRHEATRGADRNSVTVRSANVGKGTALPIRRVAHSTPTKGDMGYHWATVPPSGLATLSAGLRLPAANSGYSARKGEQKQFLRMPRAEGFA